MTIAIDAQHGGKAPARRKREVLYLARCIGALYIDEITCEPREMLEKIEVPADEMAQNAVDASRYLKTLAHEGRLMILCHLGSGEKSVGELEELLSMRQAAVSQMLARLRDDGLVTTRREGKTIYYSLADEKTTELIGMLYTHFCAPAGSNCG